MCQKSQQKICPSCGQSQRRSLPQSLNKMITQEELKEFRVGLDISNELAKEVEGPAFEKMDSKAFFGDKYLDYKKSSF